MSFAHNGTDLCGLFGGTDVVAMLRPGRSELFSVGIYFSFFLVAGEGVGVGYL